MTTKDFISQVFSRKSSIAVFAIFALGYIGTVSPGQLSVDQAGVTIVPMSPSPPAAEPVLDWMIPAEITLIACLAIIVQGLLDCFCPRNKKIIDIDLSKIKPPSPESLN